MRVLWLSHLVPYPPKGGALERSYYLLRALARNHDVHLVAFIQPGLLRPMFRDAEEGLAQANEHLSELCRSVVFLPIPSMQRRYGAYQLAAASLFGGPYTVAWLRSAECDSMLKRLRRQYSFDIVHADTISMAPYAKLFPAAKTTLDHHNVESHMMRRRASTERHAVRKFYYWQEAAKLRKYERQVCPNFDLNVTCSALDADRLAGIVTTPQTIVIPNGVDTDHFRPSPSTYQRHSLVFVGALDWYPNAKAMSFFAESIWPRLKTAFPDVSMDLIGKNPSKRLLALERTDPAFHVHGFVDDIRPLVRRAHAYICPILDGGGTKLKVLNAMAMGAALVASPEAYEGLAIQDGKHALVARHADEYVQQLNRVFDDDALRSRLGVEARSLAVAQYSISTVGREFVTAYERLLL